MIIELVTNELWQRTVAAGRAGVDHRDTPRVIHHVKSFATQLCYAGLCAGEDFESSHIEPLLGDPALSFNYFANAVPVSIIGVVSRATSAQVDAPQMVVKIPINVRQVGHLVHVAVNIVCVINSGRPDG